MAYSSNYEGKEVDKAVRDVLNHDVIVKYGNIEGSYQSQTDLSNAISNRFPINHVTDDGALPDSAQGDTVFNVPSTKAVRTYVQGRTGTFANKDLSNLSQSGKDVLNYKAGVGIKIDQATRTISNEYPATWGGISGSIINQQDLQRAFGTPFGEGNSIQDNLNLKQDKATAVTHKQNTNVGNSTTPVYIDALGEAKACARQIPPTTNNVVSGSTEVLTSGGAYSNLVRREAPTEAVGSKTQPIYIDNTGKATPCLPSTSAVSEIIARTSSSVSGAGVIDLLKMMYPVGAIYIGTTSNCPMSAVFGTWEKVATDRVLQGSGAGHAAGSTIEAGLPDHNHWYTSTQTNGHDGYRHNYACWGSGDSPKGNATGTVTKASASNSIYGKSSTVQPPAYVVNIWRRVS